MGAFFQKYLNPIGGGPLGQIAGGRLNPLEGPAAWAGPNSTLAKQSARDPIAQFLNPAAQRAGAAYKAGQSIPTQSPGPYAGAPPTLATAASGYQPPDAGGSPGIAATSMPAPRPGGQVRPAQQPAQAWMGGPADSSMLGNYAAAAAAQRAQRNANPWSAALGGV